MAETVFISVDRQCLHELEQAQKDCKRLRQQYVAARALPGVSYVPIALLYAQACDTEATLRENYEAAVVEAWETERLREGLEEIVV